MGRLIKNIQILFGVVLCLLYNSTFCQIDTESFDTFKTSIAQEAVVLHSNSDILLAGETLYFKVYGLTNLGGLSTASKVVYVELIGEDNKSLIKQKLKLDKGLANGDFFIPSTLITGNYKFVAYTKWMLNNKFNPFFQKDIYIINPFIPNEVSSNTDIESNSINEVEIVKSNSKLEHENQDIKIETKNDTYKPRGKVELILKNVLGEAAFGNYSLSVRKMDSMEVVNTTTNKIPIYDQNRFYLPEIRGEIISGQVINKLDNSLLANKVIALSIPGSHYIYKNVITDKEGKFYFNIYENYNDGDGVIQVIDDNKANYTIILDDVSFNHADQLIFNKIKLNENIRDLLLKQSIQNQIESAYHNSKRDSVIYKKPAKSFYGNPSITYVLDDYKRFPTVKETFVEVVEEAAVRKNDDSYDFKVFNYEALRNNDYNDYNPLVLFDGALMQKNSDVLDYDSNKIESISIVRGIYYYGPSIFNGIIDIKTKTGDFNLPQNRESLKFLNLNAIKEHKIYYNPAYKEQDDLKRIPDYRNQLLWQPNLFLNSDFQNIEFYTSDVTGMFEITLEGYSVIGKQIKSKGYFRVVK